MWISNAVRTIKYTLSLGGKILICGNGGSAAMASHFAAELIGDGIPCIPLTDPAIITAISNDKGFDMVFASQIVVHGEPIDTFIGLTTSGKSRNIQLAYIAAGMNDMMVVRVPTGEDTQAIQEQHLRGLHEIWQGIR